jgi:hypothetical protein
MTQVLKKVMLGTAFAAAAVGVGVEFQSIADGQVSAKALEAYNRCSRHAETCDAPQLKDALNYANSTAATVTLLLAAGLLGATASRRKANAPAQ